MIELIGDDDAGCAGDNKKYLPGLNEKQRPMSVRTGWKASAELHAFFMNWHCTAEISSHIIFSTLN